METTDLLYYSQYSTIVQVHINPPYINKTSLCAVAANQIYEAGVVLNKLDLK